MDKKVKNTIDELIRKVEFRIKPKRRQELVKLYIKGLEEKINQVYFCLQNMKDLSSEIKTTDPTTKADDLNKNQQIEFYCDTFWTWLYSVFDILAQIINQIESLSLSEEEVSFSKVIKTLNYNNSTSPIRIILNKIDKGRFRSRIKGYRHCANHRRPICIWHCKEETTVSSTYLTITAPTIQTIRYISDYKVPLRPNEAKRSELITLCQKEVINLNNYIRKSLNSLLI